MGYQLALGAAYLAEHRSGSHTLELVTLIRVSTLGCGVGVGVEVEVEVEVEGNSGASICSSLRACCSLVVCVRVNAPVVLAGSRHAGARDDSRHWLLHGQGPAGQLCGRGGTYPQCSCTAPKVLEWGGGALPWLGLAEQGGPRDPHACLPAYLPLAVPAALQLREEQLGPALVRGLVDLLLLEREDDWVAAIMQGGWMGVGWRELLRAG